MSKIDLSVFEEVFSSGYAGCVQTCECGKTYYDGANYYDWEEGELEALKEAPNATELDHSVGGVEIDGVSYVRDCDCWHSRAIRIIGWMEANAFRIGEYFRLEKERRIKEANALPVDIKFPFPEGFRSMVSAPKNATWILLLDKDGYEHRAHWAEDLSGEYQPAFQGWFVKNGKYGYSDLGFDPIAWKPIEE